MVVVEIECFCILVLLVGCYVWDEVECVVCVFEYGDIGL